VPTWVKLSPFVAMLIGFGTAWLFYIRRPDLPRASPRTSGRSTCSCSTSGTSTRSTTSSSCGLRSGSAFALEARVTGRTIDGAINGVAMGIVPFFTRLAGRAQSGYIFTYAFAMVIGIARLMTWASSLAGGAE
jgi:NADH-quinone oxidoreductase subunit L